MDLTRHPRATDLDEAGGRLDDAWRTNAPAAMRFATAVVGPVDAHDVTTAAFLRVTRNPDWTTIEHLDRYLIRAVRSEAQNLYRLLRTATATEWNALVEATNDPVTGQQAQTPTTTVTVEPSAPPP